MHTMQIHTNTVHSKKKEKISAYMDLDECVDESS